MESTPRALETPASARTRALGFTYDSESDDPYSDAVVVGSAARGPSRFRASASVAPRTPASVASATRARELAKARAFRESSRERASLKQHCEALEEKVRQLESANAHAETARLKLEAEIDAAAENDEWLRRALEARAAATTEAERERAALAMRVAELEREREVAEACLQSAEAARDATKRRLKRASAAEKAGRLAAEATAAALNGEVARLKRQAQNARFRLSPARRAVAETVDHATSPMPACLLEQRSAIKAEFGVDLDADDAERLAEDAREEAEATGRRRRVAARSPATNARESRAAADASPLPPRALAMSPAASRDDSAMGGIGDDADDSRTGGAEGGTGGGSEEVSKPVAGTKGGATRRAALVSHPAAIVFEYTPESKPPKSRSTLAVASDRKGPLAVAPPVAFEPPMAAVSAFAGVDAEVAESAGEWTRALVAAAAAASRAALAPKGVVTVAAKRLGARLAVGLAITALVMLALIVFGGDPPGARLAVRAGGWHPGWRRETWWGARVMRAMLGVAA